MKKIIFLTILLLSIKAYAADTLRVMQYNILAYGNYTSYCTTNNNNINISNNNNNNNNINSSTKLLSPCKSIHLYIYRCNSSAGT